MDFGGFRRTSRVAVTVGAAYNAHARRRAWAAEAVVLIPKTSGIHPLGMLPPYRGFGEAQVATALVATPVSLHAGTELNPHKAPGTCN